MHVKNIHVEPIFIVIAGYGFFALDDLREGRFSISKLLTHLVSLI